MRTIERNRQTVSVGCAPTPIQYFARSISSRMSLCCLPDVSYESFLGTGSYVPITSRGLLFRAVLWSKKKISIRRRPLFFLVPSLAKETPWVERTLRGQQQCCRRGHSSVRSGLILF